MATHVGNRLLASLPQEDYDRLLAKCELVALPFKHILYEANHAIEAIYFPIDGVISLLIMLEDGEAIEVATVGNEGIVGIPLFLGAERGPDHAFSQIPGAALRMAADVFKAEVTQDGPFKDLLQRYVHALFRQLAQGSACNRAHSAEQRFCKWMLMVQDRVRSERFPLTQEFIAQMLGVRRATVTEVAGTLQQAGLISYHRGIITILDREGLEQVACTCYGITKRAFDQLFGAPRG
jgi:CRP-like cAMP-binding protein